MHLIVGLVFGLVLLYFWLLGHWFARVVMFLVLAGLGGIGGSLIAVNQMPAEPQLHYAPVVQRLDASGEVDPFSQFEMGPPINLLRRPRRRVCPTRWRAVWQVWH